MYCWKQFTFLKSQLLVQFDVCLLVIYTHRLMNAFVLFGIFSFNNVSLLALNVFSEIHFPSWGKHPTLHQVLTREKLALKFFCQAHRAFCQKVLYCEESQSQRRQHGDVGEWVACNALTQEIGVCVPLQATYFPIIIWTFQSQLGFS